MTSVPPIYVTVTGDIPNIPAVSSVAPQVTFTPSGWLPDPAAGLLFPPVPQTARIFNGLFSVQLLATDTTSTAWTWQASFGDIPDVGNYVFSFALPSNAAAFTATSASPCVFTATGTAYANGQPLTLAAGSLPAGFGTSTVYYVVNVSGTSFSLAATSGGPALPSTSTGTGWTVPVVDISALAQVPSVTPTQQYLPKPSGTATAGYVPIATGTGQNSAWGPQSGGGGTPSLAETATIYVTSDGNDSNSGLSWTAGKATIAAAITALGGGGVVEVGAGTFSAGFTPITNVTIRGRAENVTILSQASTSSDGIAATDIEYLTLQNFTLQGPGSGTGKGVHLSLSAHGATGYLDFRDIIVTGFGSDGIAVTSPIVSVFTRVASSSNGGNGFSFTGNGTSVTMNSCYAASNTGTGYSFSPLSYSSLNGCAADFNGYGYVLANCFAVALNGCGAETTVNDGFTLNRCQSCTVNACFVYQNQHYGLWLTGGGGSLQNSVLAFQENSPLAGAVWSILADANTQSFIGSFQTTTNPSFNGHFVYLDAGSLVATDNCFLSARLYVGDVLEVQAGSNTGIEPPPALTPTFANGTAAQLSTTRDYMVYLQVGTAGTGFSVAIGPTSTPSHTIYASATPSAGLLVSFRLPGGWYAEWSGTSTTLASQSAIGC